MGHGLGYGLGQIKVGAVCGAGLAAGSAPFLLLQLEHSCGINADKESFSAGEDRAGGIGDLRLTVVPAALGGQVARAELKPGKKRNRLEVFHFHVARHRDNAELAVGLAHGFVEKCGDHASVYMAGWAFKAPGNAHRADDAMIFVDEEFKAEAGGVFLSAAEAVIDGTVLERHQLAFSHVAIDRPR